MRRNILSNSAMETFDSILKRIKLILYFGFIITISISSSHISDLLEDCNEFYNSSCFTHFDFQNYGKNWNDANSDCGMRGGYLTSIQSDNENTMLAQLLEIKEQNAWIGLDYTSYTQRTNWIDGTPVTYINTLDLSAGDMFHCLVLYGGRSWRFFPCSDERDYICRQRVNVFGKLKENRQFETIENNAIISTTNAVTLICRTDTYPSTTEITWEYRASQDSDWSNINQDIWNSTSGISTLTIEDHYGYYRCQVKTGGVDEIYTANVINPVVNTETKSTTMTAALPTTEGMTATMIIPTTMPTITPTPTPSTTSNLTFGQTDEANSMTYIVVGTAIAVIIIIIILVVIITILIVLILKKKKPKAYEYLSKVKYSNSLSLVLKPTTVPKKKKEGRLTYQNLIELTAGIEISEKELMDALEDKATEIPDSIYSTDYVNVSDIRHVPMPVYEEISEVADPRMRTIPLDVYKTFLNELWKKEGALEEEYKSLGGVTLKYPCENAVLEHNYAKNKYKILYPYDKSRILLTPINDDPTTTYINASYIPGVYSAQNFIATQGPMEKTVEDFWRMVVENKVENIVMLTNIIEGNRKKCEMYFPLDISHSEKFGSCQVHLVKVDLFSGYIIRVLKVVKGKTSFHVNQYHFTAWPDHDVPSVFDELLNFVRKAHEGIKHTKSSVVVHCSAGVGRTGTFITLYNIMSAIERSKPISIYKIVHEMREHRPQMVQTFRQYKFIYLAVSELLFQDTAIEIKNFTTTYHQYKQTDVEGYESFLYQQFNELNFQTDNTFKLPSEAGHEKQNEIKNPPNSIIPYDENRVMLMPVSGGNDYINASYIMNLNFIVTIHPKLNTLADFLQMIYQTGSTLVIMLTTRKEKGEMEGRMSQRASYWGKTDESIVISPFTITNTHSEKSTTMIKQSLTITNNIDGFSASFKQIISLAWNDKGEPNDLSNLIVLIQTMMKYKQENPNLPIIVHCSDGIGRTGVLMTTFKIIEDMDKKDTIDIFHAIKQLRNDRMNFVPTLAHFLSCFALTNEYCSTTI